MHPPRANAMLRLNNDGARAAGSLDLPAVAPSRAPHLSVIPGDGRPEDMPAGTDTAIRVAAILGADGSAFVLAFVAAALLLQWFGVDLADLRSLAAWLCAGFFGATLHLAAHSHYTRRMPLLAELQGICAAGCYGLMATALAAYLLHVQGAQFAVVLGWAMFVPFVALARPLARSALRASGRWEIPVLVVGTEENAADAAGMLADARHLGYRIVADIAPGIGTARGIARSMRVCGARMVLLTHGPADEARAADRRGLVEALVRERVPVAVLRSTQGLPAICCEQHWFVGHDTTLMTFDTARARPLSRALKAGFDMIAASLALAVLAPLMLAIAVLVKLDGGPVLFGHARIGHHGRAFRCLKFRTMVVNADAVLAELLERDPQAAAEWDRDRKLRNDPRVTWIGRVLRKTSLDELPQLLNVLRREMSLVGPRPIVRAEIGRYADDISYYNEIRPGITGLWQVSGRNDTGYERRVELDRWYVKNWTIGRDLAILVRTLPAVLSGRGAS